MQNKHKGYTYYRYDVLVQAWTVSNGQDFGFCFSHDAGVYVCFPYVWIPYADVYRPFHLCLLFLKCSAVVVQLAISTVNGYQTMNANAISDVYGMNHAPFFASLSPYFTSWFSLIPIKFRTIIYDNTAQIESILNVNAMANYNITTLNGHYHQYDTFEKVWRVSAFISCPNNLNVIIIENVFLF